MQNCSVLLQTRYQGVVIVIVIVVVIVVGSSFVSGQNIASWAATMCILKGCDLRH